MRSPDGFIIRQWPPRQRDTREMFRTCALLIALLLSPAAAAQSCATLPGAVSVESERYVVSYRTRPDRIVVGRHFTVDLVVCARKGGAIAAENLRVAAHMPEHRPGMNYRTVVKAVEDGRYVAEGLMFHMPGRWELVFEVRGDGRTDRLTRSIVLE